MSSHRGLSSRRSCRAGVRKRIAYLATASRRGANPWGFKAGAVCTWANRRTPVAGPLNSMSCQSTKARGGQTESQGRGPRIPAPQALISHLLPYAGRGGWFKSQLSLLGCFYGSLSRETATISTAGRNCVWASILRFLELVTTSAKQGKTVE